MDSEMFNCKRCRLNRHCDEQGALPGSRGPAPLPMLEIPGLIVSRVCFLPLITPFSSEMIRLFGHYKEGRLALPGSVLQQPAGYLEAMEIIGREINRINDEKLERKRDKGQS